jgi:hypothetical protein
VEVAGTRDQHHHAEAAKFDETTFLKVILRTCEVTFMDIQFVKTNDMQQDETTANEGYESLVEGHRSPCHSAGGSWRLPTQWPSE